MNRIVTAGSNGKMLTPVSMETYSECFSSAQKCSVVKLIPLPPGGAIAQSAESVDFSVFTEMGIIKPPEQNGGSASRRFRVVPADVVFRLSSL